MKVLIFGANGRTGRLLVDRALDQDHDVTAFVRDSALIDKRHDRLHVVEAVQPRRALLIR